MRFVLTTAVLLAATPIHAGPMRMISEQYFVPLPEQTLFDSTFEVLNSVSTSPMTAIISLAISADNTIVIIDHWEDGYETDPLNPTQATTEIWGDGNSRNGCVWGRSCTNTTDWLRAGESVVIENTIPIPRVKSTIKYDGGDLIISNLPIAVTRGGYAAEPGSLLAGALEVVECSKWGTEFVAPVGEDVVHVTNAYQYSALYIMAGEDRTDVTLPDGSVVRLNKGENKVVRVNQGHKIKSNKNVQVDLLTGDIGENYETRWFSLLAVADWSTSYVTPVGDTTGKTRVVLFNPNPFWIGIAQELPGVAAKTYNVDAGKSVLTDNIPDGKGASFTSTTASKFLALSQTDTEGGGQIYDWGFPLMPRERLSPQVLVGWGYGCTSKTCSLTTTSRTDKSRSVVFITPVDAADIYIDYANKGIVNRTISATKLQSVLISDPDRDMSGALIFATMPGTGQFGPGVDIAAAWGQNPAFSFNNDEDGLDMGTCILPFDAVRVSKHAEKVCDTVMSRRLHEDENEYEVAMDGGRRMQTCCTEVNPCAGDGTFRPGDKIRYTIRFVNVGQRDIAAGNITITDPVLDQMTYQLESTRYRSGTQVMAIEDDVNGTTRFPLDEAGIVSLYDLPRRGAAHEISFLVTISQSSILASISNRGTATHAGKIYPFQVTYPLVFNPQIDIQKTVYIGHDLKRSCNVAVEEVTGPNDTPVTYCFKVTNMGNTHLNVLAVSDPNIPFNDETTGKLAPGESTTIAFETRIIKTVLSNATVTAKPVFENWDPIAGYPDVSDKDPAGVKMITYNAQVSLSKTVYLGDNGVAGCGASLESVTGIYNNVATWCFKVTNTGAEYLNDVVVTDVTLNNYADRTIGTLNPGQSKTVVYKAPLTVNVGGNGRVVGNPINADGSDIASLGDVSAIDPASATVVYNPSIDIQKTVAPGDDGATSCSLSKEMVEAIYGTKATYCYLIKNTGKSYLKNIRIDDPLVEYSNSLVGSLAPNETKLLTTSRNILVPITSTATVTGTPALMDLTVIPNAPAVTDTDGAGVNPLYNPSVIIEKTVKLGVNDPNSCMVGGKELVTAPDNSDITYCYQIKNPGDSFLMITLVDDPAVAYRNTTVPLIPPKGELWLAFPTKLTDDLTSTVTVTANPVLQNGADIPSIPDVTDSDNAGVKVQHFPAISIEKTVKAGHYEPDSCSDGTELVSGNKGAYVTYCYLITNTGTTPLKDIAVSDPIPFSGTVEPLQPGESVIVVYQTTMQVDTVTNATATGQPAGPTGAALPEFGPVTDVDDAGVDVFDLQLAMEEPTSCMKPAYEDAGKTDQLICGRMDVYFEPDSITPDSPKTCESMSDVVLSVKAALRVVDTRYDVGWYAAVDGGDALTGTCALSTLVAGTTYQVVDPADGTTARGSVSWDKDKRGGNDDCGDVILNGASDGARVLQVNVLVDETIKCIDTNADGNLDFSICFSWREPGVDELCTYRVDDPNKRGSLPDIYPNDYASCFCTTYDVPGVRVVELVEADDTAPCL